MVMEPEPTVLATEEPETIPSKALATTATFAGPPAKRPQMLLARLMKNSSMPVRSRNAPKMMNTTMYFEQTLTGVDSTPLSP